MKARADKSVAEQERGNSGYSLVELVVVIAIIAVLTVALAFQYIGWQAKYKVESQVKEVYSDLMNARVKAMQTNRRYRVVIAGNSYRIERATNDAGSSFEPAPGWATIKQIDYPVSCYPVSWSGIVVFNSRGLVESPDLLRPTVSTLSLRFDNRGADPDNDCIVLSATNINLGKWGTSDCNVK